MLSKGIFSGVTVVRESMKIIRIKGCIENRKNNSFT